MKERKRILKSLNYILQDVLYNVTRVLANIITYNEWYNINIISIQWLDKPACKTKWIQCIYINHVKIFFTLLNLLRSIVLDMFPWQHFYHFYFFW